MFKITMGKGFHITFNNGYTVSVQFGPGNYCDQGMFGNLEKVEKVDAHGWYTAGAKGCKDAEVAVLNGTEMLPFGDQEYTDSVLGHVDADYVAHLIAWVAIQPKGSIRFIPTVRS